MPSLKFTHSHPEMLIIPAYSFRWTLGSRLSTRYPESSTKASLQCRFQGWGLQSSESSFSSKKVMVRTLVSISHPFSICLTNRIGSQDCKVEAVPCCTCRILLGGALRNATYNDSRSNGTPGSGDRSTHMGLLDTKYGTGSRNHYRTVLVKDQKFLPIYEHLKLV